MPDEKAEILEKLLSQQIDPSHLVLLVGYIGEIEEIQAEVAGKIEVVDHEVRIYPMLNVATYFKVRLSSIASSEPAVPGLETGPMRVIVRSEAKIEYVQSLKSENSFLTGSIAAKNLSGTFEGSFNHPHEAKVLTTNPADPTCGFTCIPACP